jgi:hypothetical protein
MHDEPLDERIREALEPSPEAVERIVRNALAAPEPSPRRPWALPMAVALGLVLGVTLLRIGRPIPPAPQPARQARQAVVSIANVGDVVVATSPDHGWLVGSEPEPSPPRGIIILSHGGPKK